MYGGWILVIIRTVVRALQADYASWTDWDRFFAAGAVRGRLRLLAAGGFCQRGGW